MLNASGDAYLEDITFEDIRLTFGGGGTAAEAARQISETDYFAEYFDMGTPPAFGLWARNVRGLAVRGARFGVDKPDLRPAVVLDHVIDAAIESLSAEGNPQAKAVVRMVDAQDVLVTAPRVLTPAAAFLAVEGQASRGITVEGGDLSKAAESLSFDAGAGRDAVKLRQ